MVETFNIWSFLKTVFFTLCPIWGEISCNFGKFFGGALTFSPVKNAGGMLHLCAALNTFSSFFFTKKRLGFLSSQKFLRGGLSRIMPLK